MSKQELRPVEINGHQEYWTGYFHAWAGLSEHPTAIVETVGGRIKIVKASQVTFMKQEDDIPEGKDD